MESPNRIKIAQAGRLIFSIAAVYNILWSALFLAAPGWSLRFFKMESFPLESSQVIYLGLLVGLLGFVFAVAATRPLSYWKIAAIGSVVKLGAFAAAWGLYFWGVASLKFALFSFVNDLIWVPGFVWYAYHSWRLEMEPPPTRVIFQRSKSRQSKIR